MDKKKQQLKYLALFAGGASLLQIANRFDVAHPEKVRRAIKDHPLYAQLVQARKDAGRRPITDEKLEATERLASTAERLAAVMVDLSLDKMEGELREQRGEVKPDLDRHSFRVDVNDESKTVTLRMKSEAALALSDTELRSLISQRLAEVSQLETGEYSLVPGIAWDQ